MFVSANITLSTVKSLLGISREDYIEILKYAEERHVKVLPEVSKRDYLSL